MASVTRICTTDRAGVVAARVTVHLPGLGKIVTAGPAWIFSDNLRNRLWLQWHTHDTPPSPKVQQLVARRPGLVRLAALGTVIWETTFVFGIFSRNGRKLLGTTSVAFHLGVWLVMRIEFLSLPTVHVGLIDWSGVGKRTPARQRFLPSRVRAPSRAPAMITGAIIAANHLMPFTGDAYGWPFAIYPVFRGLATPTTAELHMDLCRVEQDPEPLDLQGAFRAHQIPAGVASFLAGMALEAPAPDRRQRFEALWKVVRGDVGLDDGDEVAFYSHLVSVDPSRATSPLLERKLVYRLQESDP